MTNVAVATCSQLAADAAYEVAAAGGNAVDCGLAAALVAMNTEPGVCALAGSTFITVWRRGEPPVTIDGNVAVPGIGVADAERKQGVASVAMEYGGGIETLVGPGSVAIPGSLAAVELAWQKFGVVPWPALFAPAVAATRDGFSLPSACRYYLEYSGDSVFGRSKDGHSALHHPDGQLRDAGDRIVVPHLADTLEAIAQQGARLFYEGDIGNAIAQHCRDGGGALSREDLATYQAVEREPLLTDVGPWTIATNPPPAVGGAVLTAMLLSIGDVAKEPPSREKLLRIINSQRACLDYRQQHLDLADNIEAVARELIISARQGRLMTRWNSAATVHTSVVDSDGTGCAITSSSGYGSGEMPDGTGLWLNNCLGEIELNRRGLDAGPPGARLPSNMAPTVARRPGEVLAVGSPGADRITTALQQFLINYLQAGMNLTDAIGEPRVHVDTSGSTARLMAEPGLDIPETDLPLHQFPQRVMYFGGVGAASCAADGALLAAADPRREGGTCIFER